VHLESKENSAPRVTCEICQKKFHRVDVHVKKEHGISAEEYAEKWPDAPLMSDFGRAQKEAAAAKAAAAKPSGAEKKAEFFRIGVAALPIAALDELNPEDRAWVPKHDEHFQFGEREKTQLEALALEIEMGGNTLIVGPTGCGKSSLVEELASIVRAPTRRMNLHGDVRAAHFVGEKIVDVDPATGQSVVTWRDGLFTQAWRRGHWIILDELDFGPPPILSVLQAALENGGRLVLAENGGEVIPKHPRSRVIATANTLGRGDESGLYAGTNILNDAFLDRFGTVIEADYPDAETEKKIIVAKSGVDPAAAEMMVKVAAKVREEVKQDRAFCTLSTRRLIEWARKTVRFRDWNKAAKISVLNKLAPDDRKFVEGVVQREFGSAGSASLKAPGSGLMASPASCR